MRRGLYLLLILRDMLVTNHLMHVNQPSPLRCLWSKKQERIGMVFQISLLGLITKEKGVGRSCSPGTNSSLMPPQVQDVHEGTPSA